MGRLAKTDRDRQQGMALGGALRNARGALTQREVSRIADVDLDMLRRVEQGRVASPGFFFVGAVAGALKVPLDEVFCVAVESLEGGS